MDRLWDSDYRYAVSTIKEVKDCLNVISQKTLSEEKNKYITITRAKLSTLRKTINNLEISYREMTKQAVSENMMEGKRRDLDAVKRSQEELEREMERQSRYTELPDGMQSAPKPDFANMQRTELYDYRNSLMRAQDRELEMLDTTAGAIKSISTHIRDEVHMQSGLLGDLEGAIDTSNVMVLQNRTNFTQLIERSSKPRLMMYIVVLTTILLLLIFI
ncbi:hypothetical protein BgAZ_202520 [Babesia gibsoni]|uniref:t-SNARE coiled-coil homology domain-containing protein n=1 Tax=Babesia gibsoni TaxID=33632 RepID=A0AAD8LQE3_BABGI|nr:hypothetical protein BgAZ_202520 [Babesia gibsoni]